VRSLKSVRLKMPFQTIDTVNTLVMILVGAAAIMSKNSSAESYVVAESFMELKTSAGRAKPIYSVLEKGESFSLLKIRSDWIKVKSQNDEVGWISVKNFYTAIGEYEFNEKQYHMSSKWEVGFAVGKFGTEDSYSLNTGYYFLSDNFFPETVISMDIVKASGTYSNTTIGGANLAFNFYRYFIVSPRIIVGSGLMQNDSRQSLVNGGRNIQLFFNYGMALNANVYKNVNTYMTVRSYSLVDTKENFYDWRIGISGVFN